MGTEWTRCPRTGRGENILINELCSVYVQHGIEEATDDVSGAYLDPALVKAGRILEMNPPSHNWLKTHRHFVDRHS